MQRASWKRRTIIAVLLVGGTTFQALSSGCGNYYLATAITAFDFCAVLNCTGSTFFDLCGANSILIDCPTVTTTTNP